MVFREFLPNFMEYPKGEYFEPIPEMFKGRMTTSPIDYAFICLVSKKEGAKSANDFRPISLSNGIQKILSKVLANNL